MDDLATVHDINVLTVVANESYSDFVSGLQKDISVSLSARPRVADVKYFTGKVLQTEEGKFKVDGKMAKHIYKYLLKNDYIDDDDRISSTYHEAKKEETLVELPDDLKPYAEQIVKLIDSVFSDAMLPEISDDRKAKVNPLNANFKKPEFQALWEKINRKAIYTVHFDSKELVDNCINALNKALNVKALTYTIVRGEQKENTTYDDITGGDGFVVKEYDSTEEYGKIQSIRSSVKYDLIGKIAAETKLTRSTVGNILKGIHEGTFNQYKTNPEDFIQSVTRLINEQKATTVIEHLAYDAINDHYSSDIFTQEKPRESFDRAMKVDHHIYDYVFTDSKVEKEFATKLDTATEVVVYAKLPNSFFIPTPVGNYNPDWAIVFEEGSVKHVYFIAETKGSMSSMNLKKIEEVKIECARKFFFEISSNQVKYEYVKSYEYLLGLVK